MGFKNIVVHCLINYRWIFVCFFLLPCSILYDVFIGVKQVVESVLNTNRIEAHTVKTKSVQEQVNQWKKSNQNIPMCTGRPGWKAMTLREPKYKTSMYNIHIDMDEIIFIDFDKKVMNDDHLHNLKWELNITFSVFYNTVDGQKDVKINLYTKKSPKR